MLQIVASLSAVRLKAPSAILALTLGVSDTNPYVAKVEVIVEWGDGSREAIGSVAAPFGPLTYSHGYSPGKYQVRVLARNYLMPVPDRAIFQQELVVESAAPIVAPQLPVTYGPILPSTTSFPSPADWNFTMGRDGAVISSSLRMLVLTSKGERICDPNYGTNLRSQVFAMDDSELPSIIQEEIVSAVSRYEPRAQYVTSTYSRSPEQRRVRLLAEFRSMLSGEPILLDFNFVG